MLELWNTVFSGCTLAILTITAVLALIQLHHLRSSYQLTAASTLLQAYWSAIFQQWGHFVDFELSQRLEDPAFRAELASFPIDRARHAEVYICEYFALDRF
jgi:hypothetical protein